MKKSIIFYEQFTAISLWRDFNVEIEIPIVPKVYSQEQE